MKKTGFDERRNEKKNANGTFFLQKKILIFLLENALKRKRSEQRRRKRSANENEKKNEIPRKRSESGTETPEIVRNHGAEIPEARVAEETIARALVRDARHRPTRSDHSAQSTLTLDMETRSARDRILELARVLQDLDRPVPSVLTDEIRALLIVIVDDLARALLNERVAKASRNTAALE